MTDYVEAEWQKKWEEQRKSMEAESSSTVLEPLPDLQRHEMGSGPKEETNWKIYQ